MPMPKKLERDAYCLAPPLYTTSLRPPRISREAEARHPCAPLIIVKQEIESSEIKWNLLSTTTSRTRSPR